MPVAKPTTLPECATTAGRIATPPTTGTTTLSQANGWKEGKSVPARFLNWYFYWIYQWILWLQDITNQALTWTAAHNFQAGIQSTGLDASHGSSSSILAGGSFGGTGAPSGGRNIVGVFASGGQNFYNFPSSFGTNNAIGLWVVGGGSSPGVGPSNAQYGIYAQGGDGFAAIRAVGGNSGGSGVNALGIGNAGVIAQGGAAHPGVTSVGGSSDAAGLVGTGGSTNGNGVEGTGTGSGYGGWFSGGPTDAAGIYADGGGNGPAIESHGPIMFSGSQPTATAVPSSANRFSAPLAPKMWILAETDGAANVSVDDGAVISTIVFQSSVLIRVTFAFPMNTANYGIYPGIINGGGDFIDIVTQDRAYFEFHVSYYTATIASLGVPTVLIKNNRNLQTTAQAFCFLIMARQ